jgi:hypothetical protein
MKQEHYNRKKVRYFKTEMKFQYLCNSKIRGFFDPIMKRPVKSQFSTQMLEIRLGCCFYFFLNYCPVLITKT